MRPKSARKVAIEQRILFAFKLARERHMRTFRAVYLTPKDRRALGLNVEEIHGVPVRDGLRSALYETSGARVVI